MALKREREEHQHLLAESYAAVMDLTKQVACSANVERSGSQTRIFDGVNIQMSVRLSSQLQIGERNWGREKLELLERLSQERAQWEQRLREATSQQGMVGVCARVCVCVIRRLEYIYIYQSAVYHLKVCCYSVSPVGAHVWPEMIAGKTIIHL